MSPVLPNGWNSLPLEKVADIHDNLREPINAGERALRLGAFPYYGATGQVGWIDDYRQDGEYVLLGEDGAPFFDPTKAKAYLVSGKAWVNNHAHVLRAKAGVCINKYLLYALNAADYRGYANGTTRLKLTQAAMKRMPLPMAPYIQQHEIVATLDELLPDLDAGVANLKRAQANLKRYRAAVLKAAVEGRLTEAWRKHHPPSETGAQLLARILKQRRAQWEADQLAKFARKTPPKGGQSKYVEPAAPDTTDLPELPEGWCWARISQVGTVQLGRQRAPQHHDGLHMRPYLRVANVFEDRIDVKDVMTMNFTPEEYETYRLETGDVLLNEGQSAELVGRSAIYRNEVPCACFTNTLVRFRAGTGLITDFAQSVFKAYLRSGRFREISSITVNIAHLGAGRFADLEFPLPPAAEQQAVVSLVEEALSNIDATEAEITRQLTKAASLRQSILKAAFSGKLLEPARMERNTEPVSFAPDGAAC